MSDVVQTFWYGSRISAVEFAALQSFVRHGHTVHLYTYSPLEAIPAGCQIKDANEILPERDVFFYRHGQSAGSVSAFSNLFRYKLLRDRGGWWVDTDVICLRPFPSVPYCFAKEEAAVANGAVMTWVNCAVMKAPPDSEIMHACYQSALQLGTDVLWGENGPDLLTKLVARYYPADDIVPSSHFFPIPHTDWLTVLDPSATSSIVDRVRYSYALHLWNEMFRLNGVDKYARPPKHSYLDHLYSELLVPPSLFCSEMNCVQIRQQIELNKLRRELEAITCALPWRAYRKLVTLAGRLHNALSAMNLIVRR